MQPKWYYQHTAPTVIYRQQHVQQTMLQDVTSFICHSVKQCELHCNLPCLVGHGFSSHSVHNSTLHIFPLLKVCRVGLLLNWFMLSSLPSFYVFADLLSLHLRFMKGLVRYNIFNTLLQAGSCKKNNNRNKSRKTTTTLTYKHSNLLKTHTHTHKTKG